MTPSSAPPAGRHRPGHAARAPGFTMVEVMVTMSVLCIILASAAPGFMSFLEGQQARGLAQELATDLLLARSEAVKRNLPVSVISSASGLGGGWTVVVGANERLSTRNRPQQVVAFADAPPVITFDQDGRVAPASSNIRITVRGGGTTRCVELDLSGRARTRYGSCA